MKKKKSKRLATRTIGEAFTYPLTVTTDDGVILGTIGVNRFKENQFSILETFSRKDDDKPLFVDDATYFETPAFQPKSRKSRDRSTGKGLSVQKSDVDGVCKRYLVFPDGRKVSSEKVCAVVKLFHDKKIARVSVTGFWKVVDALKL